MKKLLSVVLLALLISLPAQADRLFTVGFEENNLLETMWQAADAGPAVQTSVVHSGTYALQINPTAAVMALRRSLVDPVTIGTLFTRVYLRFGSFPTASAERIITFTRQATSAVGARSLSILYIDVAGSDRLRLHNEVTDTTIDSTFNLAVNTWYRIEIRQLLSDTVGEQELQIFTGDSTSADDTKSITGEDTLETDVGRLLIGAVDSQTSNLFFDDIAINDDSGTFQNSFPGPGKIFLLKPSGDNSITWTKGGSSPAATNWEGVDDLPGTPDDGVTYNFRTVNRIEKLDLSNLGGEVPSDADIILVDVYGRQGSNGTTGQRNITYELWDETDSQTTGPSVNCAINGWRIADTDEHLVFDAASRSKANIDSFRVGYQRNHGGSNEDRITAQWVNVEWIEAAAAPARSRVHIIGGD